jgi:hypothetical protein
MGEYSERYSSVCGCRVGVGWEGAGVRTKERREGRIGRRMRRCWGRRRVGGERRQRDRGMVAAEREEQPARVVRT